MWFLTFSGVGMAVGGLGIMVLVSWLFIILFFMIGARAAEVLDVGCWGRTGQDRKGQECGFGDEVGLNKKTH